jgi:hypothetical protein
MIEPIRQTHVLEASLYCRRSLQNFLCPIFQGGLDSTPETACGVPS